MLRIGGPERIACNQVLYHLQERAIEHAVIPWCDAHGVAVTAYSPFGHDDFPNPGSAGGTLLQRVADAHGVTPCAVALGFLIRQESVFAIPKAGTPVHVEANAAAGRLELTAEEIATIDAAFPRGPKPRMLRCCERWSVPK